MSWKDASNEPNYEILQPMVIEILESKDTNAHENGPILNQKFNSATHILSCRKAHDSLKFLSWKDASNEPNYEILRPMVIEILESEHNNADKNGPILNQKFNNSKLSEVTCMFHRSKFLFWSGVCVDTIQYQFHPFRPFLIGSSWWKRVRNWKWCDWPDYLTIN